MEAKKPLEITFGAAVRYNSRRAARLGAHRTENKNTDNRRGSRRMRRVRLEDG